LHFDSVHGTPMPAPGGFSDVKTHGRRVTFGAQTTSPSTQRPRRTSFAPFQTPPPTIIEGEDGEAGGTVNSRNAGATPFDRRLSSLFAKYGDGVFGSEEGENAGEGFEIHEDDQDTEAEMEIAKIASTPLSESLKGLAKDDCPQDGTHPLNVQQSPVHDNDHEGFRGLEASRPSEDPAPGVDGGSQRAPTPNAQVAAVLGELLKRSLNDIKAGKEEEVGLIILTYIVYRHSKIDLHSKFNVTKKMVLLQGV